LEIQNELKTDISQVPTTQSCKAGFGYIRKPNKGEETEIKRQIFLHPKKTMKSKRKYCSSLRSEESRNKR